MFAGAIKKEIGRVSWFKRMNGGLGVKSTIPFLFLVPNFWNGQARLKKKNNWGAWLAQSV